MRAAYLRSDFMPQRVAMMQWLADWADAQRDKTKAPAVPSNYASQGTNATGRALRRFIKLRARCPGTERENLSYFPDRPKRMRETTYARIKADALDALARYRGALDVRIAPDLPACSTACPLSQR